MNKELTRREYFAAHAPEVPSWFKHEKHQARPVELELDERLHRTAEMVYSNPKKMNRLYDHKNKQWTKEDEVAFISSDTKRLIEDFFIQMEAIKKRKEEIQQWEKENTGDLARMIQWRWFYADMMLKDDRIGMVNTYNAAEFTKKLTKLISEGLTTDGDHHKQWYLEELAKALCIEITVKYEPGMCP